MLKTTLKYSLTLVTLVGTSLSSNGAEWDATNNPVHNYRLLPSLIADNMVRDAGDRFPGNFGMPILNGVDAIRAELDDLEEPLPNPLWPPPMARDAIYFGGTDCGRFIPESLTLNDGVRPDVLVMTQNALADGTYTEVLRHRLFGKCWVPLEEDSGKAFETYVNEVQSGKRQAKGDLKIENGRVQVTGALAVMEINGIISRDIFDHNKKEHDFYVEESYVIPWMYDYLTPHGFVMKLNAEPVGRLRADACVADREFWDWQTRRLLDDPQFCRRRAERWRMEKDNAGSHEDYNHRVACRAFSKTRTSIAGLYARKGLMQEAQAAFREAYMIDPQSPEAIFRSIQEVLVLTGKWNAIFDLIEHTDRVNPNNKKRTKAMRGPVRAARDAKITMDDLRGKYREQIEKNKSLENFSPENLRAFSPDDLDRLADACLDDCEANLLFGNFQMARRSAMWAHGNPARAKTFERSWRLAKIFKLLSQSREAAENVQAALTFPEANTFEVQHEAALILAQADNEDCVMAIQRALDFPESKDVDTLVQYAKILERCKKRSEAIKALNLAIPLATNAQPSSIIDTARLMLKLNATKYMPNAQCLLRPLLRRSDVSWTPETLVDYALVCYSAQMPDCAYAGFSNAFRMNPASVDALFKKRPELKSIWQELEKRQQQRSR
ncbi:MAG: hypothetical protein IKO55_02145 [Kiritimatiellae bacterium]|nr:hypothetical protein [Kiritimatiellia bacterium]